MIYDDTSYMLWNHNYQILTCKRAINSFCLNPHNVAMLIHNFCKSEGNQTKKYIWSPLTVRKSIDQIYE